jgi:hypothetical protein
MCQVFANENQYELKLYEKILPSILGENVTVYADNKTKRIFLNGNIIKLTSNCEKANILIGKKFDNLKESCLDKPVFSTSYRSYKTTKNSFGAFYWRKGRPQVKIKISAIEQYKLKLPSALIAFSK